jgi:homoserine O-succinyltransferase
VEKLAFEDVEYWQELTRIMDWSAKNVTSTLHICWGAQAGLYYRYGIHKYDLPKKFSGIYKHYTFHKRTPLVRGFDDSFLVPQSRYTGVCKEEIEANELLEIVAESDVTGPYLIIAENGKNIFVTGHPEYDTFTLDQEYRRDLEKGINPEIPCNYYPDDNPDNKPIKSWRCHANTLYFNWLNYYVYQLTPYDLNSKREVIYKDYDFSRLYK